MTLDEKDAKLLTLLEQDARQTFAALAKEVRLSKQAVAYRVKMLIESGVISRFVTIVDTQKLGYAFYDVLFRFDSVSPAKEAQMMEYLSSLPEVGWLVGCVGKWSALAAFLVRDVQEFQAALQKFVNHFPGVIREKELFIVIDAHPCVKKYLFKKAVPPAPLFFGSRERYVLQHIDRQILRALDQSPRSTNVDVGRMLGVTYVTIKAHILRLRKAGVIQNFSIKVNPQKYGYEWHNVLLHVEPITAEQKKKFVHFLLTESSVVFVINAAGAWDMMIDVHVKNQMEASLLVTRWKQQFPDTIRDYELVFISKEYKATFVPQSVSEDGGNDGNKKASKNTVHKLSR